jgi:hypothetical protein
MKLVFQENPKFGDEQDVTQQIIAIDEHIEKLVAEVKRFEVKEKEKEKRYRIVTKRRSLIKHSNDMTLSYCFCDSHT